MQTTVKFEELEKKVQSLAVALAAKLNTGLFETIKLIEDPSQTRADYPTRAGSVRVTCSIIEEHYAPLAKAIKELEAAKQAEDALQFERERMTEKYREPNKGSDCDDN